MPSSPPEPKFISMQFQDIWASFMLYPAVRSWLFNCQPLNPSDAYECVTNDPEPWSFRFGDNQSVDQKHLDNFGELGTRLFHHSGTALGVTFNASNKQPLLPIAYKFTQDSEFLDDIVVVRRCAIRKASPTSTDLIRLQCDWFESGVLGLDYAIIPASAPDVRPNVGFAVFGYRVYKRADAQRIYLASQSPDEYFLKGTTSLLSPVDGFVALDGCDSQFQTPCMYCRFRKSVLCHCPDSLRRRVIGDNYNHGHNTRIVRNDIATSTSSSDAVVWDYYSRRMKSSLTAGTFCTNWRYIRPNSFGSGNEVVCAVAHIVPYSVMFTRTGGERPIIQRVLTTLGMNIKSPTGITNLHLTAVYQKEQGTRIANACIDNQFLHMNDDHHSDAVMSMATISNVDNNFNLTFNQTISSFTEAPTSDICNDDNSDSIFFDDSILAVCDNTHIKSTSPISPEYADGELNLTVGSGLVTDLAHLDIVSSRKRYRGSPHESDHSFVKRMQYSILPSEIVRTSTEPSTDASTIVHDMNNRENGCESGFTSTAIENLKCSSEELVPSISNLVSENKKSSSTKSPKAGLRRATSESFPSRVSRAAIKKKATRIWPCTKCNAVIRGKRSNLKRHELNKHTNKRNFVCELPHCNKRFQTKLNLVRHHKLVHVGRPFCCSNCKRTFKSEETLNQHRRTVHPPGSTAKPCPFCGGSYGKQSTFSRHVASVHKDIMKGNDNQVTPQTEADNATPKKCAPGN